MNNEYKIFLINVYNHFNMFITITCSIKFEIKYFN